MMIFAMRETLLTLAHRSQWLNRATCPGWHHASGLTPPKSSESPCVVRNRSSSGFTRV